MLNEQFDWSTSVGRWFGVPIRVHLFFLVTVLVALALEWNHQGLATQVIGTGVAFAGVLLLSVLLHELAHAATVTHLGGRLDSITLLPWGGTSEYRMSASPGQRFFVACAGPFANLMVFSMAATMVVQGDNSSWQSIVNPLDPPAFVLAKWNMSLLLMIAWVNFLLFSMNLIPCFPFDGAEIARAAINALDENLESSKVEATLLAFGQLIGFASIGCSWLLRNSNQGPIQPVWAVFLISGILLLFCARYDFRRRLRAIVQADTWEQEPEFEPVVQISDDSLDMIAEDGYSQWLIEKQQQRERNRFEIEHEVEADEAREADEILSKLYEKGPSSLTVEDRKLLERVSARIRLRRHLGNVDGS